MIATTYFIQANYLLRERRYAEAALLYEKAIKDQPTFPCAWANYFKCLAVLNNNVVTLDNANRYLEVFGDDIHRISDLLLLTNKQIKYDIIVIISRLSKIDPWVRSVVSELSVTSDGNQLRKALELYSRDTSCYITCHYLGDAYFGLAKYSDAILWYRKALDRNENFGWSWLNLAKSLIHVNGNFDERLDALNNAYDIMSESMHIGSVLRPLAEHLACTRHIRRASDIYLELSKIEPEGDAILFAIENLLKTGDAIAASKLSIHVRDWKNVQNHVWASVYLDWANGMQA